MRYLANSSLVVLDTWSHLWFPVSMNVRGDTVVRATEPEHQLLHFSLLFTHILVVLNYSYIICFVHAKKSVGKACSCIMLLGTSHFNGLNTTYFTMSMTYHFNNKTFLISYGLSVFVTKQKKNNNRMNDDSK